MSLLPVVGTVSYAGIAFNSATRSSFNGRPILDDAGRTVVAVEYLFRCSTFIVESTPGEGCDTQVEDMRIALSKAGQAFKFTSKGFGDLQVNTGGAVRDVAYGPTPRLIRLEPIGSKSCWHLDFEITVTVPECDNPLYAQGVMAFNYETATDFDSDGYATVTRSGYIEIPANRTSAGSSSISDMADFYRERLKFAVPVGFHRLSQSFVEEADKRRLRFRITDRELEQQGLPDGCTNAGGRFRVETSDGFAGFTATLSATYTVARTQPLAKCYEAFLALYVDRINKTIRNAITANDVLANLMPGVGQQPVGPDGNRAGVVPLSFSAETGLYGDSRRISFELSWYYVSTFEACLLGGFWDAVPGTGGLQWSKTVGRAMDLRGNSQLRGNLANDVIIDLCRQGQASLNESSLITGQQATGGSSGVQTVQGPPGVLEYKVGVEVEQEPGTVSLKPLPKTPPGQGGIESEPDYREGIGPQPRPPAGQPPAGPDSDPVMQQRVTPSHILRLYGRATTTWTAAPCPGIVQYGNAFLVPEGRQFYRTVFAGTIGSHPVYVTEFDLRYRVVVPKPQGGDKFKAPKVKKLKPRQMTDFVVFPGGARIKLWPGWYK